MRLVRSLGGERVRDRAYPVRQPAGRGGHPWFRGPAGRGCTAI